MDNHVIQHIYNVIVRSSRGVSRIMPLDKREQGKFNHLLFEV